MQTKHRIDRSSLRRAVLLGGLLGGFLFCWVAWGAEEVVRTYDYKGFDTNGVLRVSGVISLRLDDHVKIKGDWRLQVLHIEKIKEYGPQDGAGKISGYVKEEEGIFVNLNPGQIHNNIYLEGQIASTNSSAIKGKWGYYAFVGKVNGGTFEMLRKEPPSK